jgi:hypothetical protein
VVAPSSDSARKAPQKHRNLAIPRLRNVAEASFIPTSTCFSGSTILTYTVEDLGTNFSPEDINSTGQVEGEGFSIDCGRERAILYHVVPSTDIRECLIWWNGYR